MWVYITMGASLLLSVVAFVGGLAPVGIGLIVIAAGLAVFQQRQGAPSAARAEREEHHDPTEPLGPAHAGQSHMTPDAIEDVPHATRPSET